MGSRAILISALFIAVTSLAYIDNFSIVTVISPYAQSLGATGIMLGLIVAGYSLAEDVFEAFVGYFIDRVKRIKHIIVAGLILNSLVIIFYLYAYDPPSLLSVRLAHGALGALIGPATMAMARYIKMPFGGLGGRMGVYGLAIMISTSIGFPMGGIISKYLGREYLFIIVSIIIFIGGLASILLPSPERELGEKEPISIRDWLGRGANILSDWVAFSALLAIFGLSFISGAITTLLPDISSFYVEKGEIALSTYLGITAIIAMILQLPLGLVSDKVERLKLISIGIIMVVLGLILLTLSGSLLMLALAAVPYGFGYAILFPSTAATVLSRVSKEDTAYASGLYHLMFTEGVVWGAVFSGAIYLIINPLNTLYLSIIPISMALAIIIYKLMSR